MADLFETLEEFLTKSQTGGEQNRPTFGGAGPSPEEVARSILSDRSAQQIPIAGGQLSPEMALEQSLLARREQQAASSRPAPRPMDAGVANLMPTGPVGLMSFEQAAATNYQNNQRRQVLEGMTPEQRQAFQRAEVVSKALPAGAQDLGTDFMKQLGINPIEQQKVDIARSKVNATQGNAEHAQGLLKSAGTDDFQEKFADAVATGKAGNINQQIAAQKLHDSRIKQQTVTNPQAVNLSGLQGSVRALERLSAAYEATPAAQGGKMSSSLKLAVGKIAAGAALSELAGILPKLEASERRYIAEYNAFALQYRRLTEEGRPSDRDTNNVIQAVGNPLTGPALYREQLKAATFTVRDRESSYRRSLVAQRKDIRGFEAGAPEPVEKLRPGFVRVKNAKGQSGQIPEKQLKEALAAGFTR